MAALTAPRAIDRYVNGYFTFTGRLGVGAGKTIYHGSLVVKDNTTGWVEAATAAAGKTAVGVADLLAWDDQGATGQASIAGRTTGHSVVNSGAANARQLICQTGILKLKNKAGDLLTRDKIGTAAYIEDDQTVRATATGTVSAGTMWELDDDGGVWVRVQP